jgi:RNA polymerase sigma-70 factor (ECF subfamily)
MLLSKMTNDSVPNERSLRENAVTDRFLDDPNEDSFAALFQVFTPQLVSFFRARSRQLALAEDLAQEVMLTVYRKARQIRDRTSFHSWLFKIAHNALCRHYSRLTREVETVNLADADNYLLTASHKSAGTPAFEFRNWMDFLEPRERDFMMLRFVEQWEYHEIAAARAVPIGTVQWRIFNSKKRLAGHLTSRQLLCAGRPEPNTRKEKQNAASHFIGSEQSRKAS